ncbi:MAG: transcriptional regulator [Desulfobacterales bacterium]|nr:transcriptional regulator [Desulfobacterales bacterium]
MEAKEFARLRKKMQKTQKQIAQLLGVSLKAIHSYEQGWRKVPTHAERQMLFLATRIRGEKGPRKACWTINKCPPKQKNRCPAWEFKAGKLCWFINGTICTGFAHDSWKDKIKVCRECDVLKQYL